MTTVTPFLMFEGRAREAMEFYVSLLPDSRIVEMNLYGPAQAGAEGSVRTARFTLAGREFLCIDSPAKHAFTFTPSVSIFVDCDGGGGAGRAVRGAGEGRRGADAARRLRLQPQVRLGRRPVRRVVAA